jgi:hypothetical protein
MAEKMLERIPGQPKSILELWETPPPARAVIVGKGPSLQHFESKRYSEWVVFAINEAVTATPGGMPMHVDYFFFVDAIVQTITGIPEDVTPIRPYGRFPESTKPGYWYRIGRDLPAETGAGGATGRCACVLGEWIKRRGGAPIEVLFVGCDSWDQYDGWTEEDLYAGCIDQCVGYRSKNYTQPNMHLSQVLGWYHKYLKPRWFHREIVGGRVHSKAV